MGCWHGTCGVSQLPIFSNEPVRAMLIAIDKRVEEDGDRNMWTTGICDPTALAYPITPAMAGTYDDYGGVVLTDPNNPITKNILEKLGLDPTGEGWVERLRSNDAPTISRWGREKLKIALWMVRDDIYQHMMLKTEDEEDFFRQRHPGLVQLYAMAERMVTYLAQMSADMRVLKEAGKDEKNVDALMATMRLWSDLSNGMKGTSEFSLLERLERSDVNNRAGVDPIIHAMEETVFNGTATEETLRPLCRALADHIRFTTAMGVVRKSFWVQSGAGSQSGNLIPSMELARAIAEIAHTLSKRFDEEDEGAEDEEEDEEE